MKTYFSEHNEDWSKSIEDIIRFMRLNDIEQMRVWEGVPMTDSDCFSCRAYRAMCVKPPLGEPCGKSCEKYEPRNGKWGICKHYGRVYEEGEGYVLYGDGRLVKTVFIN